MNVTRFLRTLLSKLLLVPVRLALPVLRIKITKSLGLRGKSVLVVGSAPTATIDGLEPFDFVIGVHASPLASKKVGIGPVDLLLVDQSLFNSQRIATDAGKAVVWESGVLTQDPKKKLVVVSSNDIPIDVSIEDAARYRSLLRISNPLRRAILQYISRSVVLEPQGGRAMVGTGAFAIALAFFAGARSVQLTGINLRSGTADNCEYPAHFYDSVGLRHEMYTGKDLELSGISRPRGHSAADSFLLASLYLSGRRLSSNEPELETLLWN